MTLIIEGQIQRQHYRRQDAEHAVQQYYLPAAPAGMSFQVVAVGDHPYRTRDPKFAVKAFEGGRFQGYVWDTAEVAAGWED